MIYTLGFHINNSPKAKGIKLEELSDLEGKLEDHTQIWAYPAMAKQVPSKLSKYVHLVVAERDNELIANYDESKTAHLDSLVFHLKSESGILQQMLDKVEMSTLIFSESGALVYANFKALLAFNIKSQLPYGLIMLEDFSWEKDRHLSSDFKTSTKVDYGLGTFHGPGPHALETTHLMRKELNWEGANFILLEFKHLPELKVFRTELKLSENRNKLLLERNFGAYILSNEQGLISYASGEVLKMVGFEPTEIIGTSSLDYTHPEDRFSLERALVKITKEEGANISINYRIARKDGSYRWIEASITNHLKSPGINAFVSVVRDVHEKELMAKALEKNVQRFQWASRATKDVIWDWDFEHEQIDWGENLFPTFGWKETDLNTTDKWMSKVHPEDHEAIDDSLREAFESNRDLWECHYRFLKINGEYAFIHDRGYISRNKKGEAIRLIGAMHDYSIQHKREQELKSEQLKFRQLFEGSLIGVAQLNLKTLRWEECNQALLNMLGYKDHGFKQMLLRQLLPAAQLELNNKILADLRSNNHVKAYQTRLLRKDLGTTKVVVSAFAFNEKKGDQKAWFHFLDLGPVEESNKALVEAETRFRQYIEKASDIFATLDKEGLFDYISPNVEQLLGYRPAEIIGRENLNLIHPEDAPKIFEQYEEAWSNPGKTVRIVFRFKHKRGNWVWLEVNGSFQSKGSQLKAFLNVRDIEKEHQIEAELRKLSLVANRTSNGVLIVDAQSRVEWLNESYQKLSGYSLEEARGRTMSELVHGSKSLKVNEGRLARLIESAKPFRVENINYHKNGSEYWVESIVTPIFDENGVLTNYISIETDITERKMEEISFQENMQLISEQNERLRSFGHIISHNFRSHGSNIQQLTRELNLTSDQLLREELYKYLEESAGGLMEALDELSSLLKVESASDLPTEELSVMEYCQRVKQILSRPTMEINAELHFDVPPDFKVTFYPAYLESVLFNLISNAIRYHDPEKDPWVKVWVEEKKEVQLLYVSDNGLGIDIEKHGDEIFKYRRTVHNHPDSTGIGLYLIRSQIESLGGEITVNSIVGKGTTFCVSIPKN